MLRSLRQILSIAIPVILLVLYLGVVLCFWNHWDELVVVTLIPIWAWAAVSLVLSALAWALSKNHLALASFGLWLVTGIALSDETTGLLRQFRAALTEGSAATEEPAVRLRVATLNCAEGQIESTEALEKMAPDLVLLQEAPEPQALSALADRIFGTNAGIVRTDKCAIIGRGRLSIIADDPGTGSVVATFERADSGEIIDVINLHLPRAMVRTDLWDPSSWTDLTQRRKENRRLLRSLLENLPQRIGTEHQIVGGSFGTPPNDDIYRLLRKIGLTDSFRQSGYGWGDTFPSSIPFLRVDQIWATSKFIPIRSETFATDHSDHRYVVTDFRDTTAPAPEQAK
ncbi:MAG: endonuclease/exonuclease/phosphatase family protein [Verrucomicrobiae bacterium]|nr:endonuclease/exonuclease/phosphatase family protein [Verrucomicrobiae bacterium]